MSPRPCYTAVHVYHSKYLQNFDLSWNIDCFENHFKNYQQVCIRCLAATIERNQGSRNALINADSSLKLIGEILTTHCSVEEEDARGNSALIISNCVEIMKEDPSHLIKPLIDLVDDAKSKSNRTNAAIALSKAAKYSDDCRQKFREHHGLEILQSKMSQIKI